jgi:hypothetical protein
MGKHSWEALSQAAARAYPKTSAEALVALLQLRVRSCVHGMIVACGHEKISGALAVCSYCRRQPRFLFTSSPHR